MKETTEKSRLPVMAVKNTVLFPNIETPLFAGRPLSVAAVDQAMKHEDKQIVVVAQRSSQEQSPKTGDLYEYGTRATIRRMARGDKGVEVIMFGVERVRILEMIQEEPYFEAQYEDDPVPNDRGTDFEAVYRNVIDQANNLQNLIDQKSAAPLSYIVQQIEDPMTQLFLLATMTGLDLKREQQMLEVQTCKEAAEILNNFLSHEFQVRQLQEQIASQTHTKLSEQQREHLLRQQMETIQKELGEKDPSQGEVEELRKKLEEAQMPEEIRSEAERELNRLERLPQQAPDYQMTRAYVEIVSELPWSKTTEDNLDLERARRVLDEDHYDLKDVKDRIIEHLAVLKLNPKAKSPILCLVGPPGVGKTSLGESIARSLGRRFERMSLGGLGDESELRGHRRTYIGAMPGRIIQGIRRAKSKNPLMMLDEVDKLGRDFRGDPAAALMEILDPSQNFEFKDNYLDLPFDLSNVFFVCTANTLDTIPGPLLDRMEVLRLSGYTDEEKVEIAKRYIVPRQVKDAGLSTEKFQIPDEVLLKLIENYTREAGLRELNRTVAQLCRKMATKVAQGEVDQMTVEADQLNTLLGPPRFFAEQIRQELTPGVAIGLAWTPVGGNVLYIEASILPEGNTLTLTGSLGDIMKESVQAARSYLWTHAKEFRISENRFKETGVHVHVPEGATPKDGPSAGVTMATAMASAYSGIPMRSDTAMTGEVTLTGLVLPIGGLKEKALAAHRAGIHRVIIPKTNEKDLQEFPQHLLDELEFIPVENLHEVFAEALPALKIDKSASQWPKQVNAESRLDF